MILGIIFKFYVYNGSIKYHILVAVQRLYISPFKWSMFKNGVLQRNAFTYLIKYYTSSAWYTEYAWFRLFLGIGIGTVKFFRIFKEIIFNKDQQCFLCWIWE